VRAEVERRKVGDGAAVLCVSVVFLKGKERGTNLA